MLSWQPPPFGGTAPPLWPVGSPSGTFYHTRLEIFRQLFLPIDLLQKQIFCDAKNVKIIHSAFSIQTLNFTIDIFNLLC